MKFVVVPVIFRGRLVACRANVVKEYNPLPPRCDRVPGFLLRWVFMTIYDFYWSAIVTIALSCTIFELFDVD